MYPLVAACWKRLREVQTVALQCEKGEVWQGVAHVSVIHEGEQAIAFHEKGEWERKNLQFTNTLRWRLAEDGISLEHLRFGIQNPVLLFHLVPDGPNSLHSMCPHFCREDRYSAQLFLDPEEVHFIWRGRGPRKDEKGLSSYRGSNVPRFGARFLS